MKYILFIISFFFLGLLPVFSAACTSNGDLTSSEYRICTDGWSPMSTDLDPTGKSPKGVVKMMLEFISKVLLYIIPTLAGVSGIIAGYYYIFSSGDSENTSRAKTIIKYNIIAIVVALASYSIILLITTFL